MTKIDIISGFLGAGKTTLIKKLIEEAFTGEKLVLIENEFGEIGIDGGFLKDSGINITEMNSGCICCTLVGDFAKALQEVLSQYAPDRILIEPSGVGKLSDVVEAVHGIADKMPEVQLGGSVTVADVSKCSGSKQCIHNCMNQYICIRMSKESLFPRNIYSTQDQFPSFRQFMNVITHSNSHNHSPSA